MTAEASRILQESSVITDAGDYIKAMLNILEDFTGEKRRLEEIYHALLNILEDVDRERAWYADTQRAMLNILDDFSMEKEISEAINRELRATEEQVRESLQEKEALLKEVHHRVKNNLQIIHSMLNLQLPYIKDEQAIDLFKESQNRIYSMALIHEKLYQSESLVRIDLAEYLRSLTDNLFLAYGVTGRSIRLQIQVENIALNIDTLVPCALIINELVSNSLKYAFPEAARRVGASGEICIKLLRAAGDRFVLTVSDNGIGLPEGFDIQNCKSLGIKLVSALTRQLNGSIHIDTGAGTEFAIIFARPRRRGNAANA